MSLRFGYELEFATEFTHYFDREDIDVSIDISADYRSRFDLLPGREVRTIGLHDRFPAELFGEVLASLKDSQWGRWKIHSRCGFHIHFSGVKINYILLESLIKKKFSNWRSRDEYCQDFGKYVPLRHIEGDHYECRIFNASHNLRALSQYHRSLECLIYEAAI